MSNLTVFLIAAVLLAAAVTAVCWRIRHTLIADARRNQAARENTARDEGPDPLRLLRDLDLHLNLYLVDHRELAEGLALLDQAIRDHRTNTPEGD